MKVGFPVPWIHVDNLDILSSLGEATGKNHNFIYILYSSCFSLRHFFFCCQGITDSIEFSRQKKTRAGLPFPASVFSLVVYHPTNWGYSPKPYFLPLSQLFPCSYICRGNHIGKMHIFMYICMYLLHLYLAFSLVQIQCKITRHLIELGFKTNKQ